MNFGVLDQDEVDQLLRSEGTGVLSMTDGDSSYGIPLSFGYDGGDLYFWCVDTDGSRREECLAVTRDVSFTVHVTDPAESVIIQGRMEVLEDGEEETVLTVLPENSYLTQLHMRTDSDTEGSSIFYRLSPDTITGRRFEGVSTS